ncbi:MAG: SRPBCC domain-containing protein [Candidatus Sulfotelmatobacter sp.]
MGPEGPNDKYSFFPHHSRPRRRHHGNRNRRAPQRVFQAIVDSDQARQWGGGEAFQIILWEMDPRPGGKWNFVSTERTGKNPGGLDRVEHHGEFLEFDPPRLLVQTWYANWHPDPSHPTVVRWELTPTKTGTRLKVTHSGLAPLAGAAQGYNQGWPGLVQQIKHFVEKVEC